MKKIYVLLIAVFILSIIVCSCAKDKAEANNTATFTSAATQDPTSDAIQTSIPTTTPTVTPTPNDIKLQVKAYLEKLAENNPEELSIEIDTTKSSEFNQIVALGEDALPYLEIIADRSNENVNWFPKIEFEHRLWAVHAIYAINPEVYDLSFLSPDGKYTARLIVNSLSSFYNHGISFNDVHIVENSTNKIIYTTEMNNSYHLGGLFFPEANWSADSKFVIIDCCGRRSGTVMAIDIIAKNYICLPAADEAINRVYPGEDAESLISVPRLWFNFESWETEEIVKIDFTVSVINKEDEGFSGWYTFDLVKETIKEFVVEEHLDIGA